MAIGIMPMNRKTSLGMKFSVIVGLILTVSVVTLIMISINMTNELVAAMENGVEIEQIIEDKQQMFSTMIIAAIVFVISGVFLISIYCRFAISNRIKKLGAFARKIREGGLEINTMGEGKTGIVSTDDIGRMSNTLEITFRMIQGYIHEIKSRMEELAEGDFTIESTYEFHGDFILIKDSINKIARNLNKTLSRVNDSSSEVSNGAKQIAHGADALATSSTQQAATIEQLSSSISLVSDKTKQNAKMTEQADKLSILIKEKAEKGSQQMDEMMKAVEEISGASSQIEKVIKVIDDIAFQTNILALNAAVEAARAGTAGKGFAVVAEEVRNLASKSAEAAKNTNALIENSMAKSNLGLSIATETSASLREIVTGINENAEIMEKIARLSDEQAAAITEINDGIDQVAKVVQQNSATAQESAAASHEMNGQSNALEELIRRFRL
ncbi:MAG: methyl-accepting chemotaxis protein [Oscillospiraceae bacterium]|nr:methyl-accepting chemotaxis protein [Oscillospiraceae bacterium]